MFDSRLALPAPHRHISAHPSRAPATALLWRVEDEKTLRDLNPATIVEHGGYCWAVKTADLFEEGDTVEHPHRSHLLLFENGVPLGPAHSDHLSIREFGGGRFSHWGEWLYFSSSENLPPNRNACSYVLRGPAAPQSDGNLWLAIGGRHRLGWVRRLDQA